MFGKLLGSICVVLGTLSCGAALADAYPSKPVRIVVGQGAGSVGDVRARWIAARLAAELGQPFVVENRVGAGGTIAAAHVARSPADGHTLLLTHLGILVGPETYPDTSYDPLADFAAISRISKGYGVLTVHPAVPAKTVAELVKLAKDNPGKLNYASTGVGAPPWMMAELFKRLTDVKVTHVAYKGGGEVLSDLMAGRIDYWFEGALIQLPHLKAGRLRALAVTAPQRLPFLPDVPTLAEAGLPAYEFQSWTGFAAPARTPRAVIDRLHAAMAKVLSTREALEWLADQGNEPAVESPEQFAAFMKSERSRWAPVVREAKAKS